MESLVNNLPKQGQALADKTADKANQVLSDAAPILKTTANQARALGRQGLDAVTDAVAGRRDCSPRRAEPSAGALGHRA